MGRVATAALESGGYVCGGSQLRHERRQAEDQQASRAAIAGGSPTSVTDLLVSPRICSGGATKPGAEHTMTTKHFDVLEHTQNKGTCSFFLSSVDIKVSNL
jgi:hypothetical protein